MKRFLEKVLEDGQGGISSSRLVMVIWGVGVFLVWAGLSIFKGIILTVPESVLVVVLATMGIKVVQRIFGEQTPPE